jgi:hypothetical protein
MLNSSGCIYEYDEQHPMHSGKGFTEEDPPNFSGSFYSRTKAMVENVTQTRVSLLTPNIQLIREYSNVLTLRLRMPLSDDLHPRNFVTKITKYAKVCCTLPD